MIISAIIAAAIADITVTRNIEWDEFAVPGEGIALVEGVLGAKTVVVDVDVCPYVSHFTTNPTDDSVPWTADATYTRNLQGGSQTVTLPWGGMAPPGDSVMSVVALGWSPVFTDPTPWNTPTVAVTAGFSASEWVIDPEFIEHTVVIEIGHGEGIATVTAGDYTFQDLLILLDAWGTPGWTDLDGDGDTGLPDLLLLLANWGE